MAKFRDVKILQKFATVHASIHNHFNQKRHLNRRNIFKNGRAAALAEWRQLAAWEAHICRPYKSNPVSLTVILRGTLIPHNQTTSMN